MRKFKKILLTGFLLVCLQAIVSAQSGIIETKYGKVEGYREENIRIFKGIPFAAPPIGDLRWKAPQLTRCLEGSKKMRGFLCQPHTRRPGSVPVLVKRIYGSARAIKRRLSLSECLDGCIVGI